MGRRKSKLITSGSDSDSSSSSYDGPEEDQDLAAEAALFKNKGYGSKKKRKMNDFEEDELDEGDWGGSRSNGKGKGRARVEGKRTDYTKGQSFIPAGSSSTTRIPEVIDNLSFSLPLGTAPPVDATEPIEEEEEMDMGDSDDLSSNESDDDEEDKQDEASDRDLGEESTEQLASVPGLATPNIEKSNPITTATIPPTRGLGSKSGKGGIGARAGIGGGGGGIGSGRAGIGGSAGATKSTGTAPMFASATSASAIPLGGYGIPTTNTSTIPTSDPSTPHLLGTESPMTQAAPPHAGIGSSRAGIGGGQPKQSLADSLRSRLVAQGLARAESPDPTSSTVNSTPEPTRERRSFLPTTPSITPKAPLAISKAEQVHFASLATKGDIGLLMLQKMGWKNGTGLGAEGQGIVTPIGEGQKLRKKGQGIGEGERSKGSLAEEARKRGEDPDALEESTNRKGSRKVKDSNSTPKPSRDAWQQSNKKIKKPKTEYKTYEEIVAESGALPEGPGLITDLSGNALPSDSLSSLPAFGAGSADPTRLPELRHNLSLLTSTIASNLMALAREGAGIAQRRAYIDHEDSRVRAAVDAQESGIRRLEEIMIIVEKIKVVEKESMDLLVRLQNEAVLDVDLPKLVLTGFVDDFDDLFGKYPDEYEAMGLDEVLVGAITPIMRRLLQNWNPLESPDYASQFLKRWRKHFRIDSDVVQTDGMDVDVFGSASYSNGGSSKKASDRLMTPYESMMWTVWLPRVRSAINNSWSPSDPSQVVTLYNSWLPLLPLFLRDNILDQLILPKVLKATSDWSPSSIRRGGASLHTIVFPWLELAGERRNSMLEEAKRKVGSWLKGWKAMEGLPKDLNAWQTVFPQADWDSLIIKYVLPQLGTTLRDTFVINPRQQILKPLEVVLAWAPLLRASMLSQLIESAFFPKWLDALYTWLTSEPSDPNNNQVNQQVADWYSWWKKYFFNISEDISALSGVSRGFRKGLDLMNSAMSLGDDAKYRLKRPDTSAKVSSSSSKSHRSKSALPTSKVNRAPIETSFKSIVEEEAAARELLFIPLNRVNEKGHSLYRVSKGIDGKSGVTVYLDQDVVFLSEAGDWKPVDIEEMVRRALK